MGLLLTDILDIDSFKMAILAISLTVFLSLCPDASCMELLPLSSMLSPSIQPLGYPTATLSGNVGVPGPAEEIVGTFVAPCENTSWFVPSEINLTSAKTMRYWDNLTFEGCLIEDIVVC